MKLGIFPESFVSPHVNHRKKKKTEIYLSVLKSTSPGDCEDPLQIKNRDDY